MLDWLRPTPHADPQVEIAGRMVPVAIRRLAQARRLTMRLAPDGSEVRISMPRWGRTAEALAFAESRRDWLARQLAALPAAVALADGAVLPFRGVERVIDHDPAAARRPELAGADRIRLGGPATSLAPRLERWLRTEALALMADDLAEYCARAGQPARRLSLSSARRRWGSCGPDGAIRINWRLIMAPDMVRRSVVAHEVAHLIHFDHSPAFHHCLGGLFEGSVHEANRWLKAHGRSLHAPFG